MSIESLISDLEREWDFEEGFLGRLRRGNFVPADFERLSGLLDRIETQRGAEVNRRMVSLLWYMPLFMQWQRERVRAAGGDLINFEKAVNYVQSSIERILGIP